MFDEHRWTVVTSTSDLPVLTNDADYAHWLGHGLVAFTGRYRVEGNRIVTKVDVAWNPAFVGVEMPREIALEGDRLTITQPEW